MTAVTIRLNDDEAAAMRRRVNTQNTADDAVRGPAFYVKRLTLAWVRGEVALELITDGVE